MNVRVKSEFWFDEKDEFHFRQIACEIGKKYRFITVIWLCKSIVNEKTKVN